MRIIDKIQINYFRSIYTLSLPSNGDITLFVGSNDVGKSNILKALNLFFNNQSELDSDFNFLSDLSRLREEEARSAKGRATIWIRVTFKNFLGWKSLPPRFSIKRSWNRYSDSPIETYPKDVQPVTIGKFLNRITFHYIPAVRARNIFEYYLSALHDGLIDDEKAGVRDATNELMDVINVSTQDMSERIYDGLGFRSNIQVPQDLRELFKALDFSTVFGKYNVPLQKRGDGIQARHIPFILDFIARHSNRYHIWAYEEPENSLEMSRAFELAEQFSDELCVENQIFITTHSPAFYDLGGDKVTKWFVESEDVGPNNEPITTASLIGSADVADRRLGIAALVADRAREMYDANKTLREDINSLKQKVAKAHRAQVIVEGPTDQKILAFAAGMIWGEDGVGCDFIPANGASNVASFIKASSKMQRPGNVPIIGLVDNDNTGRKEARYFNRYTHSEGTAFRVINKVSGIYFGTLPVPDEFEDVVGKMKEIAGQDMEIPLSIELMFSKEIINEAIEEGVLLLRDRMAKARDSELALEINLSANFEEKLPNGYAYFVKEIEEQSKKVFAEWICRKGEEEVFENFRPLLETLKKLGS